MRTSGIEVIKTTLGDHTATPNNFGCTFVARKEGKSVRTEIDLLFTKLILISLIVEKLFQNFFLKVLTAINFNSFQRKSISTLIYASMESKNFVIFRSSLRHYDKSGDYEKNDRNRQKTKKFGRNYEKIVSKPFKP